MIEERFQIVGTPVAIIDIVRMFPHVATEKSLPSMGDWIFAVRSFGGSDFTILED